MGHIDQPCDVDRLCGRDDWTIYELVMVVTPGGHNDIRLILEMVVNMFCAYVLLCIFCSQCPVSAGHTIYSAESGTWR